MTAWLQKFAADRGLECRTDKTGNVLIVKEAAPGKENVPALVLPKSLGKLMLKLHQPSFQLLIDRIHWDFFSVADFHLIF